MVVVPLHPIPKQPEKAQQTPEPEQAPQPRFSEPPPQARQPEPIAPVRQPESAPQSRYPEPIRQVRFSDQVPPASQPETTLRTPQVQSNSQASRPTAAQIAAGGALLLGGLLFLSGKRRAGTVAATTGTALALLDQQDTISAWWKMLPVYLDDVQRLLTHVQASIEDVSAQRENLRKAFSK